MKRLLCILTGIGLTAPSLACQFHGDNMAGFARYHPMMQQHFNQPSYDTLNISFVRDVKAVTGEEKSHTFSFFVPTSYYDASVKVESSDDVTIVNGDDFRLSKISEKHQLKFISNKPGTQTITLVLSAKYADKPVSIRRTLTIQSA